MKVQYRSFEFDTDTMRAFSTGVKTMPTLYVNDNGLCFVETWRASWEQPRFKHVHQTEALRLAESYRLDELKSLLKAFHHRQKMPTTA